MFSLPALAVYTVFWIFPVFLGFYISFTNWNGIVNLADAQFTGFKNYVNLLYDSILRVSVLNNIKYGIITLIVVPVAAFAVAYLVHEEKVLLEDCNIPAGYDTDDCNRVSLEVDL